MKKAKLFYILFFLLPVVALARQDQKKSFDSAVARKAVNDIKLTVTISEKQEQQLFDAALQANENKRKVYEQYWKTAGFREELAKATFRSDSLYGQILGNTAYLEYRKKLHYKQEQAALQQRIRYRKYEDSLMNKRNDNE